MGAPGGATQPLPSYWVPHRFSGTHPIAVTGNFGFLAPVLATNSPAVLDAIGILVAVGAPTHLLGFGVAQLVCPSPWPITVLGSVILGAARGLDGVGAEVGEPGSRGRCVWGPWVMRRRSRARARRGPDEQEGKLPNSAFLWPRARRRPGSGSGTVGRRRGQRPRPRSGFRDVAVGYSDSRERLSALRVRVRSRFAISAAAGFINRIQPKSSPTAMW